VKVLLQLILFDTGYQRRKAALPYSIKNLSPVVAFEILLVHTRVEQPVAYSLRLTSSATPVQETNIKIPFPNWLKNIVNNDGSLIQQYSSQLLVKAKKLTCE
jgi:hypothetical protein